MDDEVSLQPPDPIQPQTQDIQPQFPLQQIWLPTTTQAQTENPITTTPQVVFALLQHSDQPNLIKQEEDPTKLNPSDELTSSDTHPSNCCNACPHKEIYQKDCQQ